MKLIAREGIAGPGIHIKPGDEFERPEKVAKMLIQAGSAYPAPPKRKRADNPPQRETRTE